MRSLAELVSPTVMPGYKTPPPDAPALSLLAFSGFVPVTIEPNPAGPNNVIEAKDGKNPAGQEALSSLKDVLATGSYKHPVHGWSLDVTPDKMKAYCAAFSEMKNAGVKVPIYADHKPGAATTLGYCRDLFMGGPDALKNHPELAKLPADQAPLDPNKMYAIHDWASPEAQKMGHGVGQVSVLIDKKMKDGTGKSYGEAVRHIAVTPEPIVPGQGAFTQLAASLLELSRVGLYALDTSDGDDMDYPKLKATAEKHAEKAKGGDADARVKAAMAHNEAADAAPSPEEKEAHLDCAAKHLREAAYAVGKQAKSPEEQKAEAIKTKDNMNEKYLSLISPAVLALSRFDGRKVADFASPTLLEFGGPGSGPQAGQGAMKATAKANAATDSALKNGTTANHDAAASAHNDAASAHMAAAKVASEAGNTRVAALHNLQAETHKQLAESHTVKVK